MRSSFLSVAPLSVAIAVTPVVLGSSVGCGGSQPAPQNVEPQGSAIATAPPPPPPCTDAPFNPAEALAKEPAVLNACLASAGKFEPSLCGQAKIAFEIGKDGRVTRAEVAQSSLPTGVTECLKARLAAMQFACPKEGTATYTVPVGLPIGTPTGACPGLEPPPVSPPPATTTPTTTTTNP